jgi:hypothetical protein
MENNVNFNNFSSIPSVVAETERSTSSETSKSRKTVPMIPRTDIGVLRVSQDVFPQWDNAKYPIAYATREEVSKQTAILESSFSSIRKTRGVRSPETGRLGELDKVIDTHIEYVKGYLREKYGKKAAISHYPAMGIDRSGQKYNLPRKHSLRVKALQQLVEGIELYEFGAFKYGTAFWSDISNEYAALEISTRGSDGSSTADTAAKNKAKNFCLKWLKSITRVYEANHPEDWTERLRTLGFQKEKY